MSSRLRRIASTRPEFRSVLHDERVAAVLGVALGVAFTVCFATGVLSHVSQNPPGWFSWPARPAGLYRFTQGLHVTMGIASIPLLLAKMWAVYPNLFEWPPVRSIAHAVERLALLPLVGGGILLLFTGLANVNLWRPWTFSFRSGHYAAAWIVIGGMVVHVGAKWTAIRAAVGQTVDEQTGSSSDGGLDRRGFLATVFGSAGLLALVTVGQAFEPLRKIALLAPRRPDVGPQGFPVNRTAGSVGLDDVDLATWRLHVDGPGVTQPLELTYADLEALPQRTETLPIACVEGWSTSQRWTGVPLRDLFDLAGADRGSEAIVYAMHDNPRQRTSPVNAGQARDRGTLLALRVNGEVLAADHGFPVRLIGPNRPGVHQTKWVTRVEVTA